MATKVQNGGMHGQVGRSPSGTAATVAALVMGSAVLAASCGPGGSGGTRLPSAVAEGETASPGSTGSQDGSGDGWIVLFDGQTVSGLRAYGGGPFPADHWRVVDGTLRTLAGPGVDLATDVELGDFELELSWAVVAGGNSGVLFRVVESAQPAWTSGPEYQLLDDDGHPDGADPRTAAGALYGLLAPADDRVLRPVGELNDARIVVRAGRVEHWLNGARVLGWAWDDPALRALVAASKFRDHPAFMTAERGRIVLQHHGEEAWFGPIRVRPLDD